MKKRVWRHEELAPFSLNLDELRAFCSALSEEFDDPDDVSISIEADLPGGVSLEFESVEEMVGEMTGGNLLIPIPDVINEFKIWIHGQKQSLRIEYHHYNLLSKADISASSEKEVWCGGVIEKASSILSNHRVLPRWCAPLPFAWLISWLGVQIVSGFAGISLWLQEQVDSKLVWACLAAFLFATFILYRPTVENLIFPAGAIRVKEKEGFLRRRSTEFTVIAALLSAAALLIGLFKGWIFGS